MRKTVLLTTRFYEPGYLAGGPIRSIANLVNSLSSDFDWKILTSDRDLGVEQPYSGVTTNRWSSVGNAEVWYASPEKGGGKHLLDVMRDTHYDLLYLNSFFDAKYSIAPLWAMGLNCLRRRPVLIAPRGEFSLGAMKIKPVRKELYAKIAYSARVYQDVYWHASNPHEAQDIGRVMHAPTERICVASDIPLALGAPARSKRQRGEPLRVCFLSRIARMKNLDFALRALALTRQPISFSVYGPQEDPQYWSECEALVSRLPPNVEFKYGGSVAGSDVLRTLASNDLFFLPTRGENYGHVIVEAWSAGLPVLISDRTPWRCLESKGVGWDISLGDDMLECFAGRIDAVALSSPDELDSMRARSVAMAHTVCQDDAVLQSNREMFYKLLAGQQT